MEALSRYQPCHDDLFQTQFWGRKQHVREPEFPHPDTAISPSYNHVCRTLRELDNILSLDPIRMAVPSRCYSSARKVAGKPLLGVRVVVKDIFDVKGFKTSLCNRAWMEYYPPKSETAPSVKRLQALGAVIIGKARLNAMVVREEAMECVEFLAPFNPRGDGYQTPSGSSTGSCVALSAYPWIDLALGSDS
jgi:Asp-tRNA(Asn)/Glu-tRNA(Gln) amidotransferase A subunit family amidase